MDELSAKDVFEGDQVLEKVIEELDSLFPSFLPTPISTISEIMFRSGQRSVVEYLLQKLEN
jgi:hypothetical protein